ncbi:MAG: 1-acyl-sn-glycerol-3-phosphate acyltransferase [Actinomycetota bacterium]|nr:1-acyl-sn-glycerol-3-phosphate acyltransferase [Actinomycetota bacterium]
MSVPFYYFIGIVSWPVARLLFRLRARGVENVPRRGGFVLAANHVSNFDPWAVGMALWPRWRLRWMAKAELFNPILKPILLHGGAFPVRRGERDTAAIRTAITVLRQGDTLVMFPEGTRRRKGLRKKHQPHAHTGTARIALAAGVPIVPAALAGTDRLSRLGPVRVVYGPPVALDDLRDRDTRDAAEIATERLMRAIAELEATL